MSFDPQRFVLAFGIPHVMTDAGRSGWVNTHCPFCPEGDNKFKLGLNPEGYGHCWRCGRKDLVSVVCKLLRIKRPRAEEVIAEFRGSGRLLRPYEMVLPSKVSPPGAPLGSAHKSYLAGRGFDPDWLEIEYGLLGTAPREEWEGRHFGNRVIVPLHDRHGRLVSFQGRDITGESKLRYKGCPIELSPLHYKRTLYGHARTKGTHVVVVEGIFGQWRLGRGSVATFGTDITRHQLRLLAEWPLVLFAFDSEPEAQAKAMKHARELVAMGRRAEVIDLELEDGRDVGDLTESEVAPIRAELELV